MGQAYLSNYFSIIQKIRISANNQGVLRTVEGSEAPGNVSPLEAHHCDVIHLGSTNIGIKSRDQARGEIDAGKRKM